ncbi:MAG: RnfABCDGE type electron transport complex subunit B [Muribaculum sp.]|nr:RnfABCDGE type electron transport complex subunit B [Muribaculum sp.]
MSIFYAIIVLGGIGLLGACILYLVSKRFYVKEDPRIALIEELLPGANCGSCGRSGCHDFACACASATSLHTLVCPGAGEEAMKKIADIVGIAGVAVRPKVAVLKCGGTCRERPTIADYDGAQSCAILNQLGSGTTGCSFGCLGCGDCADVCNWDAIHIDSVNGLPVVNEDKCTGCGMCTTACPRRLLELRPKGASGRRVWVACSNIERGAVARKACSAACIGCMKCVKACQFDAVSVHDNLSYINAERCRLCRKCVLACPTGAILESGFPVSVQDLAAMTEKSKGENS